MILLPLLIAFASAEPHPNQQCDNVSRGASNVFIIFSESVKQGARLVADPQDVYSIDGQPVDYHCSKKCCEDYDDEDFPCDAAVTIQEQDGYSYTGFTDQRASCLFFSCIDKETGKFVCKFGEVKDQSDQYYGQYITWINGNNAKTRHLLGPVPDAKKVPTDMKTNLSKNELADSAKDLKIAETVVNETQTEDQKLLKSALKVAEESRKRIITPLLLIIIGVSVAFAIVFVRYRKLKHHIRYDALKQNDYYSKLDPDDMAAEQEAQALINGAYDI